MRKVLIPLVIFCCFYTAALAQNANPFEFGVEAGFNTSYAQDTRSGANSDAVWGFNLGATGDYYFSDHWSLKAKLLYDQKGWGNGYLIAADGSETTGINFRLNYLTLPVMASFHFGRLRNFYIDFGPYMGVLLNAEETNDNSNIKDYFNNADFGFDFGIGVKFPVSKNVKFFIEAAAQAGVLSIINQSAGGSSFEAERSSLNCGFNFR